MFRRFTLLATIAAAGMYFVALAPAQDGEAPRPRRLSSLSERLEQFRRDLLGEDRSRPDREPGDEPAGPPRKGVRRPRTVVSPPVVEPQTRPAEAPLTMPSNSGVVQPPYLKPQAARRAQSSGAGPVIFEPGSTVTDDATIPRRRPAIIRPSGLEPSLSETESHEAAGDDSEPTPALENADENTDEPITESDVSDGAEALPTPAVRPSQAMPDESLDEPVEEESTDETSTAADKPLEPTPAESVDETDHGDNRNSGRSEAARTGASRSTSMPAGVLFESKSPVISVEAKGPRKVLIGKESTFVVQIRNTGAAANNVVVTVNIPSYAEVISAKGTVGAAHAPAPGEQREPLEWRISRLEADSEEHLELVLVPRKNSPLDLAVHWTFTPEASQTLVEVQEPKLAMTISGPEEVLYGQSKVYKLTVSNPGNGDSENVTVGLLPIGRSGETAGSHRLGTLHAGESKTIDIELTARQAGTITIKAQAFGEGGLRAEASEQVHVRRASLRIEVAAPRRKYAGTVGTYHVKVTNAGDATAENAQVSAVLPADGKYIASTGGGRIEPQVGKVTWNIGTLQPGAERAFEMQCALAAPGENRTQFVAAADGDLSASATSTTHVEALADLKLEVRDPQGPIAVDDDTVYEVHIRNRGTKNAENIDLTVFFSEGLEATSVEGGRHDISAGQVVFRPIGTLAAGDSVVYRVHAKAGVGGNHVFRAEMVCQSPQTKLAAEEATLFYGDDAAAESNENPPDAGPTASRRGGFSASQTPADRETVESDQPRPDTD